MTSANMPDVPQSPETQPPDVREELEQYEISHDGNVRTASQSAKGGRSLGAVEDEVTLNMPPLRGPADLFGEDEHDRNQVDPGDEITPG